MRTEERLVSNAELKVTELNNSIIHSLLFLFLSTSFSFPTSGAF